MELTASRRAVQFWMSAARQPQPRASSLTAAHLVLVRGKDLLRFFFFSLLHCADILSLVSGAALVQMPDSRSLFRGVRTATAIDPACRSANLFGRTVSHFSVRHARDVVTLCP
jgi:hypothetical protein